MPKPLENMGLEQGIEGLFLDAARPCPAGTALLHSFVLARPADFGFLTAEDLVDLRSSAFAGISEWEAFVTHYTTCELCIA